MPMSLYLADYFQSLKSPYYPNYDPVLDGGHSFYTTCEHWQTQVETVLRGLKPIGEAELKRFWTQLKDVLPSTHLGKGKSGRKKDDKRELKMSLSPSNLKVDDFAKARNAYIAKVDQLAKTVFDTVTVPGPGFDDNEYLNATGIICIGTIESPNQNDITKKWMKRKTYSGNFPKHQNDAVVKPANQRVQYVGAVPDVEAIEGVKPNVGGHKLLGQTRHAEDEWFARYLTAFRTDLTEVTRAAAAPKFDCDASLLEQVQEATKVVFQVTANPCLSDDRVGQTGCMDYFGQLLRASAGSYPIVIYWHRPYDPQAAVKGKHVTTIDSKGKPVTHLNGW
jgi:hypothetical protein